jgi:serine/threonine-protein kinase
MTNQDRLDALLVRYEELRAGNTPVSAAALCHDCPELRVELERQIADLDSLNALLDLEERETPSGVAPEAAPASALASSAGTIEESLVADSRFRVVRLHAKGGLGEVHLAHDEGLQRDVALKRLQPLHAHRPESRRRFLREAAITSHLEHPNIVPVHAVGADAQGQPFYAMRFVQGQTLLEALEEFHAARPRGPEPAQRRLALRQLLSRFVAVCNTVAYAHSRGIIHRDIKPGNILLGKYGETLLLDWGLARRFARPDSEPPIAEPSASPVLAREADTQPGDVLGTPAYMSPEQAGGRTNALGPASDVYSLGATLYALLTGAPPFQESHLGAVLDKVRRGDFPPPRRRQRDIPRPLEAICLKAMARLPEQRYASALELAADLEHWLADEPVRAWREPWSLRARRWLNRHRTVMSTLAAMVLVAAVSLAVATWLLTAANVRERRSKDEAVRNFKQAEHNRDQAEQNFQQLLFVLGTFTSKVHAQLYQEPGATELRKTLLEQVLIFLQKLRQQRPEDTDLLRREVALHTSLAWINSELGLKDKALEEYGQARDLWDKLVHAVPDNREFQVSLAENDYAIGAIQVDIGRWTDALRSYQQAYDRWQRLAQTNPTDLRVKSYLALCLHGIATVHQHNRAWDAARDAFTQTITLQQELVRSAAGNLEFQSHLAQSYSNLAGLQAFLGKSAEALRLHEEALRIRKEQYRANPTSFLAQRDLAGSYYDGGVLLHQTDAAKARQFYEHACDLWEGLLKTNPNVLQTAVDLANAYVRLGDLEASSGKPQAAHTWYEKALAKLETVFLQGRQNNGPKRILREAHVVRAEALTRLGHRQQP